MSIGSAFQLAQHAPLDSSTHIHIIAVKSLKVQAVPLHSLNGRQTPLGGAERRKTRFVLQLLAITHLLGSLSSETTEGKVVQIGTSTQHNQTPHTGYHPYQKVGDFVSLLDKMNGHDTEATTFTMSSTSVSMDTGIDTTQDTSSSDRTAGVGQVNAMMRCGPGSRCRPSSDGGSRDDRLCEVRGLRIVRGT